MILELDEEKRQWSNCDKLYKGDKMSSRKWTEPISIRSQDRSIGKNQRIFFVQIVDILDCLISSLVLVELFRLLKRRHVFPTGYKNKLEFNRKL
ncbi:hypothetical protein M8J77_003105 [Diaphorina citri]|nr:hypothetical protein M8J77_003105 [Diaphorina citri]